MLLFNGQLFITLLQKYYLQTEIFCKSNKTWKKFVLERSKDIKRYFTNREDKVSNIVSVRK